METTARTPPFLPQWHPSFLPPVSLSLSLACLLDSEVSTHWAEASEVLGAPRHLIVASALWSLEVHCKDVLETSHPPVISLGHGAPV